MAENRVLVLSEKKQPLMPCHPARARQLLSQGKAAVWRRFPFTIVLTMVEAVVPKGKKAGRYVGRVAVRSTGSFNIKTRSGTTQGISYQHCRILQHTDGYAYTRRKDGASSPL